MSYTPFLIANYATGLDREVQPWLLPNDAQDVLYDGFVYRGVWQKREGYTQYAHGQKGGTTYCESRMVHAVSNQVLGAGDGVQLIFDSVLSNMPVRRGSVVVSYTIGGNPFTATDNSLGVISGTDVDSALSTVDYRTGDVHLVFTSPPDNLTNITANFDYHPGLPVMGIMNFYTEQQEKELIVADTDYVNRYNVGTNRLDDISPAYLLNGTKFKFFSWVNYNDPNNNNRLLFVNNSSAIQKYDGTTVSPYPVYTTQGAPLTAQAFSTGTGVVGPYTGGTPANTGILRGATTTVTDTVGVQTITFDQFGVATGNGTGTIDFLTGQISVTFTNPVGVGDPIVFSYTPLTDPITTALHIFQLKDRLLVLRPVINGKTYNKRFLISGTGVFCDTFTTAAVGAGVIDIPDNSFITSADFNRDDLIIFTALSTWIVKYTGNDIIPFSLDKIDNSRGSDAPYGTISYLNTTSTASTRGFIICDGYTVSRSDDKIPDYSFNQINQDNFELCFAGTVDVDRDHYLIHPSTSQEGLNGKSDVILVYNYEELNYSVYRIPLSCMGTYLEAFTVTWSDLLIYNNWDEMAAVYGNWNAFPFSKSAPISIGGGHEGQIFQLNVTESEDYDVNIYNVTIVDSHTLQITTDFQNYAEGDYVTLDAIQGMVQANNIQGIVHPIDSYTFNLEIVETIDWDPVVYAYTGGGKAYKVIVFESRTKKFNPFADSDKKVRCGWMYFYVSTSGNDLTNKKNIFDAVQISIDDPCVITILNHGYANNQLVQINGVQGMVELNGNSYFITVVDANNFSLNGTAGVALTPYVAGGFCEIPQNTKLLVNCIVNDRPQTIVMNSFNPDPFEVNLDDILDGEKKWYKLWINQVGKFVQFEVISRQAGSRVQIQAIMPGFGPVGRLI